MRNDILKTVEVLCEKIRGKEEEAMKLKKIVNDLCTEEGEQTMFPNVTTESVGTLRSLRSDQFYGQTLSGAARQYLEMRRATGLGAASVADLFQALKSGGYKFETKNDDYAKNGLRIALRKSSSVFHRLPNGDYGLLSWYERPKATPTPGKSKRRRGRPRKVHAAEAEANIPATPATTPPSNGEAPTKTKGRGRTRKSPLETPASKTA